MRNRFLYASALIFFSSPLMAFPCYFTLIKDNCWLNYDVTVQVTDASTGKPVTSVEVPKGSTWERISFTCQAGQKFNYSAVFKPEIWQGAADKVYTATHYWFLPDSPKPTEAAWDIQVCFPKNFSGVPIPDKSTGNCACEGVPAVKPLPASTNK